MSHTPEPWKVAEEAFDNGGIQETVIRGLDDRAAIAVTLDFGANNPAMREANASRIVACVNACAGIPSDMVSHVVAFGLQGHNKATNELSAMKAERDELLAALTGLVEETQPLGINRDSYQTAIALIVRLEEAA